MSNLIKLYSGEEKDITLDLFEEDGHSPLNVTGYTGFTLYVKSYPGIDDNFSAIIKIGVVTGSPTLGLVTFTLRAFDTLGVVGLFSYFVKSVDDLGNPVVNSTGIYMGMPA